MVRPMFAKVGTLMHIGLQMRSEVENSNFLKFKIMDGRHVKKLRKRHMSVAFWAIRPKFGTQTQFDPLCIPTIKNLTFPKSNMEAAAILKNRKSAISPERFDLSSVNLVRWRIFGLRIGPAVEICNYWQSNMAHGRHHEKSKNRHISAGIWAISTEIGRRRSSTLLSVRPNREKCGISEIQHGGGRHVEKS